MKKQTLLRMNLYKIIALLCICFLTSTDLRGVNKPIKENWADSISFYQSQYEKYSETDPPTIQYLEAAFGLSFSCRMGNQYELGEEVAAKALVHGSVLADSCCYSSGLFSMLAFFYEQRGDTIMPIHFHNKSQILGLRNYYLTEYPDSFEVLTQRANERQEMLNKSKMRFDQKHPLYLGLLNEWCLLVGESGNIIESKYLGEEVLKIASDSMLMDQEGMCGDAYFTLLFACAAMGELDRAEELLPLAFAYFEKHPFKHYSKTVLYLQISEGLIFDKRYSDALPFLYKAKDEMVNNDTKLKPYINERIELCKKNS